MRAVRHDQLGVLAAEGARAARARSGARAGSNERARRGTREIARQPRARSAHARDAATHRDTGRRSAASGAGAAV